jgi:hypothetical protein
MRPSLSTARERKMKGGDGPCGPSPPSARRSCPRAQYFLLRGLRNGLSPSRSPAENPDRLPW